MSESAYDVIVIGAGPAGYPCAIRAAQNGLKVACVDEWKNRDGTHAYGGTCLNAGCIPSKALLESSELYHRAKSEFAVHGITAGSLAFDVATMQKRKAKIVKAVHPGRRRALQGGRRHALAGPRSAARGQQGARSLAFDGTKTELAAKHVVLASGSVPMELEAVPFDGKDILDSWGALELDAVPKRLAVIGAGVIGLELGSVWRRLGAEVVVLEALEQFLFMADQQLAKEALKHFRKQGLDIRLGAKVGGMSRGQDGITLKYEDAAGAKTVTVDKVVVAIGRRPYTHGLLGEGTGVELDERGCIKVDHECRTGAANVWAVGDAVRGPMLAHKGKEEGVVVGDLIAGLVSEVNYKAIPSVIYTAPEIAWVGQTEEEVKEDRPAIQDRHLPVPRERARPRDGSDRRVLQGDFRHRRRRDPRRAHLGPMAGELIAEAVLALEYSASTEDLQRTMHAHPTLSEALHEAALAADKRAIDMPNR